MTEQLALRVHLDGPGEVRWHEVTQAELPVTRASCSGGYNAQTGEVYFGFGNSNTGVYQDVVALKVHE